MSNSHLSVLTMYLSFDLEQHTRAPGLDVYTLVATLHCNSKYATGVILEKSSTSFGLGGKSRKKERRPEPLLVRC